MFDNTVKFITKWASIGSGDGQFNSTLDIVSDATGNVYVANANNKSVQKFDDVGKFIGKFAF
jgi:DNA-binding beta-propeller fold protein YncE